MILWVGCIVFMSVLGKWGETAAHMLSAAKNWELASPSPLPKQVHLHPWGWNQAKLSTRALPQEEAAALLLLLPVRRAPAQTPAHSSDNQILLEKGWVKICHFPICRSAWMLTLCLQKTGVFVCVFLPTLTISSSWQLNPKASVCIGLISCLLLSVSNLLKYFFGALFQGCYWKWGSS